jgi:4-hydroxy-3-methylbut-2-enyl diphosphate reductase
LLEADADLAIIVGGYNSSNTSHLVELCEKKLPSYFIDSANRILSEKDILHCNWRTKEETLTNGFLPAKQPVKILMTSGASCPDAIVEEVIRKLVSFFDVEKGVDEVAVEFQ